MKAVVAAFNQEKALVGAFSVITNIRMELFQALINIAPAAAGGRGGEEAVSGNSRQVAPEQLSSRGLDPVFWAGAASGQLGDVTTLSPHLTCTCPHLPWPRSCPGQGTSAW